jgi:hypothetical protein
VIINDPGGSIVQHAFDFAVMAASGAMFQVIYCASACVMALATVPKDQVCFYPSAWIGYHTEAAGPDASGRCCFEATNTMRWERGRDLVARGYRECSRP